MDLPKLLRICPCSMNMALLPWTCPYYYGLKPCYHGHALITMDLNLVTMDMPLLPWICPYYYGLKLCYFVTMDMPLLPWTLITMDLNLVTMDIPLTCIFPCYDKQFLVTQTFLSYNDHVLLTIVSRPSQVPLNNKFHLNLLFRSTWLEPMHYRFPIARSSTT